MNKSCIDCKIILSKSKYIRCHSCAAKHRWLGRKTFVNVTKKYLIQEYINKNRTQYDIAQKLGCSHVTILNKLKQFGINRRGYTRRLEKKLTKKFMYKHYVKLNESSTLIARLVGCHTSTILFNLKKYNIKIDASKHLSMENNGCWNNGSSFKPYSIKFTKQLKLKIRIRDGYKCQLCGITEIEHAKNLSIHHINYNKLNCKKSNLITLCRICNSKVNANRKYWKKYFHGLLKKETVYV